MDSNNYLIVNSLTVKTIRIRNTGIVYAQRVSFRQGDVLGNRIFLKITYREMIDFWKREQLNKRTIECRNQNFVVLHS